MKKIIVLPVFFLILISILIFFTKFKLKTAVIISQSQEISGLEVLNNQNILVIDLNKINSILLNKNPNLKEIKFEKILPDKMIIQPVLRTPIALIGNTSEKLYIDNEGKILQGFSVEAILPIIETSNNFLYSSHKSDWRIEKAAFLLNELSKQNTRVDKMTFIDDGSLFNIYLNEGSLAVIPYESDPYVIATSLQIIMSRFRIEGKLIKKIDFRFDKPIVILSTGEKTSSL